MSWARKFQKAGVFMEGLCPKAMIQEHIWENDEVWETQKPLISIINEINGRFGRGILEIATLVVR